ncbi:hypothetical protein ACI1MP_22325 [Kitasatospora griseola]|uniref:hypothetical protein n=1 Tax=Kitasatospora griseola TaxID=2064 RepID=UPI003855E49C
MSYQGSDGDNFSFGVTMPTDENGLLMLACPQESEHRFAIAVRFGGAEETDCFCPYCGHREGSSAFLSPDTRRRITEAAEAAAIQYAFDEVSKAFGNAARRSRYLTFKPGPAPTPGPIYTFEQEKTRRTMSCSRCGETVAVFGIALFCPECGKLAPAEQFSEIVDVQRRTLQHLQDDLGAEARAAMGASGALTAIYESTIKDTCAALETLLKEVFAARVADADQVLKQAKKSGNVFQRLDDAAALYRDHLGIDMPAAIGDNWDRLVGAMAARHVLVHNGGIVDQKYLARVPSSAQKEGQRIHVSRLRAEALLDAVTALSDLIV